MQPYWEPQEGGLCRMHALNAFFGKREIDPEQFKAYCSEYDEYATNRYKTNVSSSDFDVINSDQMNVISWILKKKGIWTQYYALNELYGKQIKFPQHNIGAFVFVYNSDHIWGIKCINDKTYCIDSLSSGPILCDLESLQHVRNIGLIFPVEMIQEYHIQIKKLQNIIPHDIDQIRTYLIKLHNNNEILGDIEIPLNKAIDILEWHGTYNKLNDEKYRPIRILINDYNKFLSQFVNGRYLDLDFIQQYLPDILYKLCG